MKRIFILILVIALALTGCNSYEVTHEREAYGKKGMVASASAEASQIGLDILQAGGNAVDAAVAVGFALGVLEPNASGIGGGGFMLIKMADDRQAVFIDFREVTPILGTLAQYDIEDGKVLGMENEIGPKSIAIPGEVKGLLAALDGYGTLDRQSIMKPSIDLAYNGITVTETLASVAQSKFDLIMKDPNMFEVFTNMGLPLMAGDQVINSKLGDTLTMISDQGVDGFYKSSFTEEMVASLKARGSYIELSDFNDYEIIYRQAIEGNYRGYDIISAPPASSGGTHVIEILNILENFEVNEKPYSAENLHLWSEAYKLAYRDRNLYMADPSFVNVPTKGLTSKDYAKDLASQIDLSKVSEIDIIGPQKYESGSTTHYSIIDKDGNMVSVTKTINHFFGSGIMEHGIVFNDEIADLSFDPSSPNVIEPGKRPLSSMSPTLIMKDSEAFATLGTPGGKRIISTIPWIISQMIDYDKNIQEAIDAMRLAQYDQGPLYLEGEYDEDTLKQLETMGHEIKLRKVNDLFFGGAQGVMIYGDGMMHGGADLRRSGYAKGY